MKIKTLQVQNYRNIESMVLECHPSVNVLVGDNGQGKTNLIESIVYMSLGRSFRINQDIALIKTDEAFAKIESKSQEGEELSIVISKTGKYITRNGAVLKRLSDLIGLVNVVLFKPDDLNFFINAPRMRRAEIDYELGKSDPLSLQYLNQYRKLLSMRNAALKADQVDSDYLEILDEELINISIVLIEKRNAFIKHLEKRIQDLYCKLSLSDNLVSLTYQSVVPVGPNLKENLKKKYADSKTRDLSFKMTHIGIHREDYIFMMNGAEVSHVASQGQRRLIMLAYKFALIEYLKEELNIHPILCLDDLYSELDQTKRTELLQWMPQDIQIFITTTDIGFVDSSMKGKVFNIHNGKIMQEVLR